MRLLNLLERLGELPASVADSTGPDSGRDGGHRLVASRALAPAATVGS
jgi:hypothetical protein